MTRMHLFELEDQPWFPAPVRRCMQDFLAFMGKVGAAAYAPFTDRLRSAMARTGSRHLVDLCSGSEGPMRSIVGALSARGLEATATLTDLYPNQEVFGRIERESQGRIRYHRAPVDARAVPPVLPGFRLICNGLHHLRPADARQVLADATRSGSGIAVVEVSGRSLLSLASLPVLVLASLLVTPFLRPFRWSRLLLTYLLPIVPLALLWDGFASCLRVYAPAELCALTAGLDGHAWEAGRDGVVTYLIGTPRSAAAASPIPTERASAP
jgi:hypothetical protein